MITILVAAYSSNIVYCLNKSDYDDNYILHEQYISNEYSKEDYNNK